MANNNDYSEKNETKRDAQEQVQDAIRVVNQMKRDPQLTKMLQQAKGVLIVPDYVGALKSCPHVSPAVKGRSRTMLDNGVAVLSYLLKGRRPERTAPNDHLVPRRGHQCLI